jgi:hypothetical protein
MVDGRKDLTSKLKQVASKYFAKKNYSVHFELGLVPWGKLKADIFAFNYGYATVICEVKSCYEDFGTDKKWRAYTPYADRCYFVIDLEAWSEKQIEKLKTLSKVEGWGILVVNNGRVKCLQNSKNRATNRKTKTSKDLHLLIKRIAFRAGITRK